MSKLWRSQDLQAGPRSVNFNDRPLPPPASGLPRGGIQGLKAGVRCEPPLSHLERSEVEARRILDAARAEAEVIQRDAYHAGFEQGERAGQALAMQKIEPTIQEFLNLIEALERTREQLIAQHENELIKIAFSIALRVLHRQIELQPDVVRQVIDAALAKLPAVEPITIHLAPHDRELVEQQLKMFESRGWQLDQVRLEADPEIMRGGCRVHTETGSIDASIESQLRMLKSQLWDV